MKETLLMMAGLPGTGKSTLATAIGRELGWIIVDKDIVHSALIASGIAMPASAEAAYSTCLRITEDLVIRQGMSVIFDSAGRHRSVYSSLSETSRIASVCLTVIHCKASVSVREHRLAARSSFESQLASNQFSDQDDLAFYAHLPQDRLIVDSSRDIDMVLAQSLAYLRKTSI